MVKLHNLGAVNDELLLHVTGKKSKSNSYRKVSGALAKFFCCNTPAYAYPLFKTHKLSPENLLNVYIKDIPLRLLQSAGNISTSQITAFLELIVVVLVSLLAIRKVMNLHFHSKQSARTPKKTARLSSQVSLNKLTLKTHLS